MKDFQDLNLEPEIQAWNLEEHLNLNLTITDDVSRFSTKSFKLSSSYEAG